MKTFRTWIARQRSLKARGDAARRKALRRRLPMLDDLEGRQLLSTTVTPSAAPAPTTVVLTVTNDNDIPNPVGAAQQAIYNGSLRGILNQADAEPANDTVIIDFDSDGGGFDEFQPVAPLPLITRPVTIDGTTQPLTKSSPATGTGPNVQIDGGQLPLYGYTGVNGLTFTSGASGSVVKGVEVTDFQGTGLVFAGVSNITLTNDTVGVQVESVDGYQRDVVMANDVGVEFGTSSGDTINDVTIAGNWLDGLRLFDTSNSTVENSFIGTDPTGTLHTDNDGVSLGNGGQDNYGTGLYIYNGSANNTVTHNVISNNGTYGILLSDPGTNSNTFTNNDIGTNLGGTSALGNVTTGVMIQNGASYNTFGSWSSGGSNVISGNGWDGVDITGSGTEENQFLQDYIGTNQWGTAGIANWNGVEIQGGASLSNFYLNTISGNASDGVYITDSNTWGNSFEDNYIGTDAYGLAVGNGANGMVLVFGTYDNTIYANTIEYNGGVGLYTYDTGPGGSYNSYYYNTVVNNYGGNISFN